MPERPEEAPTVNRIILMLWLVFSGLTFCRLYVGDHYPYPTYFGTYGERCGDFTVYYMAGQGDLGYWTRLMAVRGATADYPVGWLYLDPLRFVFWPLGLLPLRVAHAGWYVLQTLAVCRVFKKLLRIPNGWILALASFKVLQIYCLNGGNITPILLALALTPVGAFVSGLFKPQYWGLGLLHGVIRLDRALATWVYAGRATPVPTPGGPGVAAWVALQGGLHRAFGSRALRILGR